jgi:hypothetical protein
MVDENSFHFFVPEQGVDIRMDAARAKEFVKKEQEFYNELQPLLSEAFVFGNHNYGHGGIQHSITLTLRDIPKQVDAGNFDSLTQYAAKARTLSLVVGQGLIGQRVRNLMKAGAKDEAKYTLYLYSREVLDGPVNGALAPIRAAAFGHPAFQAGIDVISAKQALESARETEAAIGATKLQLDRFVASRSDDIELLAKRYREEIVFEKPANYWAGEQRAKSVQWITYLTVFGFAAILPVILALSFPGQLHEFIAKATETNQPGGMISLGGVAVITVPALFYAWLLKNISRLFNQAHTLADDAGHRRALAITYLGLAENKDLGMSEQERALILNALFRPLPQQGSDEGPPNGLLDLLRSRSN